jgi:hypothetical protein
VDAFDDPVRPGQAVHQLRLDVYELENLLRFLQRSREHLYLRLELSDTLRQAARIGLTRRVE